MNHQEACIDAIPVGTSLVVAVYWYPSFGECVKHNTRRMHNIFGERELVQLTLYASNSQVSH